MWQETKHTVKEDQLIVQSFVLVFVGSGVMSGPQSLCVCSRIIPQFSFPGTIGMNNRGAMGGTNVPAPAPPAAGPGAMIPDGAMGMVVYHHLLFVHTFKMQMMLFPVLSTSC